jgi:glutamate N-acetyltransferase/amino-acid N-acetyltransferase
VAVSAPLKLPRGFRAAAGTAGIKASGRPDCALIAGDAPLRWALAATTNTLQAACVVRNRARFAGEGAVRAVVINSGNANCATGEAGVRANDAFAAAGATALGVSPGEVLTASTGVIGEPLPVAKLEATLPSLAAQLTDDAAGLAQAILTTDLVPKTAAATLENGARLVGVAKGSGMIHPNMATMFAFVMTDADLPQGALRALWHEVVAESFNQVSVDGDTSPNDMAFVFANPRVAVDEAAFAAALTEVARSLAKSIARDGEGATKLLCVRVTGATDNLEARRAARAVASSALVKAAAHGCDPNWGRVLSAVGAAGVPLEPSRLHLRVQGVSVYAGAPAPFDAAAVSRKMDAEELVLELELAAGSGTGEAWGCDLSAEYVKINADYHT